MRREDKYCKLCCSKHSPNLIFSYECHLQNKMCNVLMAQCQPCLTWSPVLLLNVSFIFLIILLLFLMDLFCRYFWCSILHVRCFGLSKILPVLYFVTSTVAEAVLWSSSKLGNYTLSVVSSWLLNIFAAGPCDWRPLALSEPEDALYGCRDGGSSVMATTICWTLFVCVLL